MSCSLDFRSPFSVAKVLNTKMSVIIPYVCHDYSITDLKSNSGCYCTQLSEKIEGGRKRWRYSSKTKLCNKKYYEIKGIK